MLLFLVPGPHCFCCMLYCPLEWNQAIHVTPFESCCPRPQLLLAAVVIMMATIVKEICQPRSQAPLLLGPSGEREWESRAE